MGWDVQIQSFRPSPRALYLPVEAAWLLAFATLWRGSGDAAEDCAILAKLAPDPYQGQGGPDGWPKQHSVLNLSGEPIDARRPGREHPAPILRYEWWPDRAEGQCDGSRFPAR